jgi:hypothetical protein
VTRLLLLVALLAPQEKAVLGAPFADGETFTVDLTVKTRAIEKDKVVFELEHGASLTWKAAKGGKLQATFRSFSLVGGGGEKKLEIRWDNTKKLEAVDWTGAETLRDLVKAGVGLTEDGAGNVSKCSDESERYLVMLIEPLLVGSATWLPGASRDVGAKWEQVVSSEEADVTYAGLYEKNESGAAVVASKITIKDRKNKDAGPGAGTGTTRVDPKTGRPLSAALTLTMEGTGQTVKLEATAKVVR